MKVLGPLFGITGLILVGIFLGIGIGIHIQDRPGHQECHWVEDKK